ncbi:hypothetical protein SFUMM280S_10707 [Streptomyces fumanus]
MPGTGWHHEGVDDFVFVSGRLSLDLAGTLLWRRSRRTELLRSPDDLRRWIRQAALLDAPGPLDARALTRTCRLREAVYTLVRSWPLAPDADSEVRDALAVVNEAARLPLPRHQLDEQGHLTRTGDVDEVLGAVARDAVDLLGGADPSAASMAEAARSGAISRSASTARAVASGSEPNRCGTTRRRSAGSGRAGRSPA